MNEEVLDSLDFFSNLTQRTLSAFHLTVADDDLYEEIKLLENILINSRKRKLVNAKVSGQGYVDRFFSDGYQDNVLLSDIMKPSYINLTPELSKIDSLLNRDFVPILSLRLGRNIIVSDFKEIKSPIEKIFFI